METGTIYMIGRAGVTRDMFTVGDTIRVAGHKSQAYPDMFWLKNVLLPNGREVVTVANSPPRWADEVTGAAASGGTLPCTRVRRPAKARASSVSGAPLRRARYPTQFSTPTSPLCNRS